MLDIKDATIGSEIFILDTLSAEWLEANRSYIIESINEKGDFKFEGTNYYWHHAPDIFEVVYNIDQILYKLDKLEKKYLKKKKVLW